MWLQMPTRCGSVAATNPFGHRDPVRILLTVLVLAVTACSHDEPRRAPAGSADAPPAYGDIMVEGSIGNAPNLIPLLASDSTSHEIAGMIFNGRIQRLFHRHPGLCGPVVGDPVALLPAHPGRVAAFPLALSKERGFPLDSVGLL